MRNAILTLALFAVSAIAAPAPYPVTINSRAQTAPPLTVYRAAESLFRVSFVDGDTASDITGATAFMSFATNATAAVVSTASVSVVAGMTGVVDCVFSPAAVNVAAGRYMYEVGVTPIGGTARIYRQGVFTVVASPYAGSAAAVTWATNMTWGTINWTGLPNWLLVSETAGWETGSHAGLATTGDVAAAIAAIPAADAFWPHNATASSWFTFTTNSGAVTITGYNIAGGTDVVIPDYINGWPVTTIGANAFWESGVTSIGGAGNVVTVGESAFGSCHSLASAPLPQVQTVVDFAFSYCTSLVSVLLPQARTVGDFAFVDCTSLSSVQLPQAQTVGGYAFDNCTSLASLYFDNDAPTIGADIFTGITPNQVTNYVTNPQATGWGDRLYEMPVVRLPLYADAVYQAGELVATTGHVAQAIAAIPVPDMSDRPTFSQIAASNALPYTAWTGTVTPADGTATVAIAHGNMPVLVTAAPCVLTLDPTGYGTAGVSRVSLSYYTGTNALTFATNVISYAETPTVDTNGWNTLLIRRVSNSDWNGVGL
jgi:hypothetical protein